MSSEKANAAGADKLEATPVAAAALLLALLRATDRRLAGCYPNANPGLAAGVPPVGGHHFIVGDFLVIDVSGGAERFLGVRRVRSFATRAGPGRIAATARPSGTCISLSWRSKTAASASRSFIAIHGQ